MVKYNILLYVIKDYVEKCSVTMKGIIHDLTPRVREIAETDEDYDMLMEYLPRFYMDYYNAPVEHLTAVYQTTDTKTNKTSYTSSHEVGDEDHVDMPTTLKIFLQYDLFDDEGVKMTFHNHPSSTCFQSMGDFITQTSYSTQYGVTISKDGIMISKTDGKLYGIDPLDVMIVSAIEDQNKIDYIDNHKDDFKIHEIQTQVNNGKITDEEGQELLNKQYYKYLSKNIESEVEHMDEVFALNGIPISCNYIKIHKTWEDGYND